MNPSELLMTDQEKIAPVHPGEILEKDFLEAYGLSQNEVAKAIRVDAARINQVVRGERSITADTALRLAKYFDTSPGFWMNLQRRYDLEVAEEKVGDQIEREVQPLNV